MRLVSHIEEKLYIYSFSPLLVLFCQLTIFFLLPFANFIILKILFNFEIPKALTLFWVNHNRVRGEL